MLRHGRRRSEAWRGRPLHLVQNGRRHVAGPGRDAGSRNAPDWTASTIWRSDMVEAARIDAFGAKFDLSISTCDLLEDEDFLRTLNDAPVREDRRFKLHIGWLAIIILYKIVV